MSTTDTNLTSLVINKLTKAQYAAAIKNPNELYITTDVPGVYLGNVPASISADGNYPLMRVGLSDNLYSPSGNPAPDQTFIYRSTGGDSDVSDGYAELERLVSTTTPCTTIKESVVATPGGTVTTVTVNESTFKTAVSNTAGTYNFSYNGTSWVLNGSNVTLSGYGISVTGGTLSASATIKVVYTKESIGTVTIANPVSLFSVGMNQFDKNGDQIFDGYGISVSGDITATSGHKVIYFRVLGGNQYTIYNSVSNAVVRFGFIATKPTTSSTLVNPTASSDAHVNHFTPTINGYICVDTTDIANLCCHLTWSGYNDEVYEDYFYDELIIPYEDASGTTITNYGLITLDSTYYDEIDLKNKVFYKRTARMNYSVANLATVKAMGVPYIYDSNYIYYGVDTVIHNLSSSINMAYRVSDFGTEEFTDTKVALTCDILYQENLRDKIRRLDIEDLQLISNKVVDWSTTPSDEKYPSEKLVKESLDTKANINGNYPEMIVGLADNLVSPDGLSQAGQHFIYRSTGGSADVSDGYAELSRIHGAQTTTSNIEESITTELYASGITAVNITASTWRSAVGDSGLYTFDYYADMSVSKSANINVSMNKDTFISAISGTAGIYEFTYAVDMTSSKTGSFTMTLDKDQFIVGVSGVTGTYVFTYDSSAAEGNGSWTLDSSEVSLSTYGIETTGTVANGNTITVNYIDNYWTYNGLEVDLADYGITVTGTPAVNNYIDVTYSSIGWRMNETSIASLSTYGISVTGTAKADDKFIVDYTKAKSGIVTNSNPTSFFSVGMNQFNKNGTKILSGYTVDSSGNVTASSGSYVVWFKALGSNKYTIYNSTNNAIKRIAFSASEPTSSSTGLTVSAAAIAQNINYYTPAMNGYIIVATTDIANLCCHLTWSGYNDDVYQDYFDYTITIPYTDAQGNTISSWGMPYLSSTYFDEIDFVNKKYYKRVERAVYDATEYASITTAKVHDDKYMFYGIPTETYDLDSGVSGNYRMSDFGTEEFVGTMVEVYCDIQYQDNLRDRLRRLATDPRSDEEKLATASWVNDHEDTLMTNCIKEIPQDISLELNNGTLTLKSGSKVYVPNGFESDGVTPKFDEVAIISNLSRNDKIDSNGKRIFVYRNDGTITYTVITGTYSGSTAPSSYTGWFYDTTNNIINVYHSGTADSRKLSFPLCIVSADSNGVISSIDQVFNGFGYIGSTIYALPGVKGLIPNGRNDDGTLKNIELITNSVYTFTTNIGNNYNDQMIGFFGTFGIQIRSDYNSQYNAEENKWWNPETGNRFYWLPFARYTSNDGKFLTLTPREVFHYVDNNDFNELRDTTLNYGNITNCITKIPQDISLVLDSSTHVLTLKSGSKFYFPKGFESNGTTKKFTEVVVTQDCNINWTGPSTKKMVVVLKENTSQGMITYALDNAVSGSTDSKSGANYHIWYDTNTNYIKCYTTNTKTPEYNCGLPIAIITMDTTGVVSIDQVFNGFGYIGSTVFALPGVEGLIPDGRNKDGILKNTEFTTSSVSTYNMTANKVSLPMYILSNGTIDYFRYGTYFEDVNKNIKTNINEQILGFEIGKFSTDSNSKIISFITKTAFHSLDYSVPHIIETYRNGTSWYRVYSDGWCEQGGLWQTIPNDTTITFMKAFTTVPTILIQNNSSGAANYSGTIITSITNTSIKISDVSYGTGDKSSCWMACAYIN